MPTNESGYKTLDINKISSLIFPPFLLAPEIAALLGRKKKKLTDGVQVSENLLQSRILFAFHTHRHILQLHLKSFEKINLFITVAIILVF